MRINEQLDGPVVCASSGSEVDRAADAVAGISFTLSRRDHADLIGLLDDSPRSLSRGQMWTALATRTTSGEIRMTPGDAEELLEWLRVCARESRASCDVADLERALTVGRVALAVQRALAKLRAVSR